MADEIKVPMMLFDGECAFCKRWIHRWQALTGPLVHYAPYQRALAGYPQVTREQCERAVRLILPDGAVFSGAHAVFKALALAGRYAWLLRLYEKAPLFAPAAERCYQLVAHHRVFFSRITF